MSPTKMENKYYSFKRSKHFLVLFLVCTICPTATIYCWYQLEENKLSPPDQFMEVIHFQDSYVFCLLKENLCKHSCEIVDLVSL